MMIGTSWCLFSVLTLLYYTQKVSCDITMQDILQNFVYSLASRQLNGVSVRFKGRNFISFDVLKEQANYMANFYDNKETRSEVHNFLELFQEHLPNFVYCKYAERITVITQYIYYIMEQCKIFKNENLIKSLNVFIQQLVELVKSIQNGIQYVSQLGSRDDRFPYISYFFLKNPLKSGPIEQVGIQNYIDHVLYILKLKANNYMTEFCVYAKENIPTSRSLDEMFAKHLEDFANDTELEFLVKKTEEYFTETNTFMTHLDTMYKNVFEKNYQLI